MVSAISTNDLAKVLEGYKLCAQTEGKSQNTIKIVANSVHYLERFLRSEGFTTDVTGIGANEIRAFIAYLQQKKCFSDHPFTHIQTSGLSTYSINGYMRAIRAFWSWLFSEGIIAENPFQRVKIPRAPHKLLPTFSDTQLEKLLKAIDITRAEGFRDYVIILTLLDTGLRASELINLKCDNLRLDEGVLSIMGKGGKQRLVPIGKGVQRLLWKYMERQRPELAWPQEDFVFLTHDGRRLTRNRLANRISKYGRRAGIAGVRCSPHTFRHTAAVSFLRNGGDVFSLQKMLGHSTLQMTRHYCELADVDVKRAHISASPVDNLGLAKV